MFICPLCWLKNNKGTKNDYKYNKGEKLKQAKG